jgi:hypothetical protein
MGHGMSPWAGARYRTSDAQTRAKTEAIMDQGKLQVGIWFMLPILGLLLLVVVLAGRGGVFVLVPAAALIGLGVLIAYFLMRGEHQ